MHHHHESHEAVADHAFDHAAWKAARAARHAGTVGGILGRADQARNAAWAAQQRADALKVKPPEGERVELRPLSFDDRSANELRPATFDQLIGQERLKRLMRRIIGGVRANGSPLDHMLLAGASGTGKTTLAQVTAHELGRTVYQLKAPVTHDVLRELARVCVRGDVVIVDEIHQQVKGDRRGATQAADPEDFYHIMEDRRLPVAGGMLPFPEVTFVGATTDEGLLPEAFLNRFPLRLTLDPYTWEDMQRIAVTNAHAMGLPITDHAAFVLGRASRRNPRQINTYIRNAVSLGGPGIAINRQLADEVVFDLNATTWDGLTPDMQKMLLTMLRAPKHRASISTIATALGHSRDTKAVQLFVEPYLIGEGWVDVHAGVGRILTPTGVQRAEELTR